MKKMKRWAGVALALATPACAIGANDDNKTSTETVGTARDALTSSAVPGAPWTPPVDGARGRDPATVHGPLYIVSVAGVQQVTTANRQSEVSRYQGGPSDPSFHQYAGWDQVRVDLGAVIERNGSLIVNPVNPMSCQIGEPYDGGQLGTNLWTHPLTTYTKCAGPLRTPEIIDKPMQLGAPLEVQMNDTLDLYAALSVLDSGDLWVKGSNPNDGFAAGLVSVGGLFAQFGAIWSGVDSLAAFIDGGPKGNTPGLGDFGQVGQGAGSLVQTVAQAVLGQPTLAHVVCSVPGSLVPGFGSNDTPNDDVSPVLRVQLNGRDLYKSTADGDALLYYDLDFRQPSITSFCQRPHTRVALRIRRVTMNGVPGAPVTSTGSNIIAPYPDRLDAFSIDAGGSVVHDQRIDRYWATGEAIPSQRYLRSYSPGRPGGGFWANLFSANANVSAISKAPGQTDVFAVDVWGDIVGNWRAEGYDGGVWHDWYDVTSGGLFTPGAPLAVVSRSPRHMDVFGVAKDGSVASISWEACCGWRAPVTVAPAGSVEPWDGAHHGGLGAAARTIDNLDVFFIGSDAHLWTAYWSNGQPWGLATSLSPNLSWAYSGTPVAVTAMYGTRLDVFWVNTSGNVVTQWWDGVSFSDHLTQVTPSDHPVWPLGTLAVVPRRVDLKNDSMADNEHMDLFAVGLDGHIIHVPWVYGMDNYSWSQAHAESLYVTADPNGTVGAIAPWAGSIEVVATKTDASIAKTWYEDVEPSNIIWQSVP